MGVEDDAGGAEKHTFFGLYVIILDENVRTVPVLGMLQGLAFQHEEHLYYDVCSSTQASHTYPTCHKQTMLSFINI